MRRIGRSDNKMLILSFGVLSNIVFITIQLINHGNMNKLGYLEFTIIVMYFACKWGNNLIQEATKKEAQANELLNSLDKVVKEIENNTSALNKDI